MNKVLATAIFFCFSVFGFLTTIAAQCRDKTDEFGNVNVSLIQEKRLIARRQLFGFLKSGGFNLPRDKYSNSISYECVRNFERFFYPGARIINVRDTNLFYIDYQDYGDLMQKYFSKVTDIPNFDFMLISNGNFPAFSDYFVNGIHEEFHFCTIVACNVAFVLNDDKEVVHLSQARNKINRNLVVRFNLMVDEKNIAKITSIDLIKKI